MSRHKKNAGQQPEEEGLLVFGYSSRIYPNDSRSELIAGESHLQPWPMDESVLIDRCVSFVSRVRSSRITVSEPPDALRFDVRLLLSTFPSESRGTGELNLTEEKEEKECEDERWKDLHDAELASLKRMEEEEVEIRPKKAEYAFTYDQPSIAPPSSSKVEEEEDDSEDEPFIPPSGIKLPLGLETPDNQKLNHVIERTAVFVVKQGAQMEIVIKAKQRTNQEQFGFLHFDHPLNPYYKYIMKLIREGKYAPDLESKKKKKIVANGMSQKEDGKGSNGDKKTSGNALTALMAQHGSDSESDSDCELHPSLLAGSRRGDSPDPVERGVKSFAGPMKKPMSPPPKVIRSDYRIETANDAYSTLFKNLAQINVQREKDQEEIERAERREERKEIDDKPIRREEESEESTREWQDFTDWFISFYGMSPPLPFCNMPYIPPPPDIEQALAGYARYVGENGAEAEFALKGRVELQLHFLTPSNPHHLYYLSAVRRAQWEKNEKDERDNNEVMSKAVVPPPPPLNRKQRRMAFMDAPQVSSTPLPSVIDPTALLLASGATPHSYETPMVKSASSPLLSTVTSSPSYSYPSPHPMSPAPPAPPSSLSVSSDGDNHSGLTLLPCPVPPNISSLAASQIVKPMEIMTERQLKARLFMEKILNDKRKKKEEETTKGVEGIEEGEILESEEKEGRRGRREGRETREDREERKVKEKERKDDKGEKKTVSASFFDNLIKSKMNALLKETVPGSLAVEKKNEEIKESKRAEDEKEKEKKEERRGGKDKKDERREKEREERKRKREKKEKKDKKRRSRSRSSSCDERRRRRRRSRSASSDLPSKYRRR